MIERVARAIEAVNRTPESSAHTQRISTPEDAAEYYRTLARVAVMAMREPSGDILERGVENYMRMPSNVSPHFKLYHAFNAVIDAALNEGNK